ncbi:MAG: HEPN domain-containing protein, partial [Anaerolineae bacterium]|nr:HEPN domain-containing protein [Anaerolineae bacterium]
MRAGDDGALTIVRQWVEKADSDFKTAVHMLKLRRGCPTDTVCYHAQQCVEKYLKAMLVLHDMQVPHVHDVRLLVDRLPSDVQPDLTPEERERMTEYAVTTRYPGD